MAIQGSKFVCCTKHSLEEDTPAQHTSIKPRHSIVECIKKSMETDLDIVELAKCIKYLFSLHCPDCGGELTQFISPTSSMPNIYHCESCGKDWI